MLIPFISGQIRQPSRMERKLIAPLIFCMAGVPSDPLEVHLMPLAAGKKFFPEISIFSHSPVLTTPPVRSPAVCPPLLHRVYHVFRVTKELYLARLLQRSQASDDRGQLHPIIGGEPVPS